MIGKFRIFQVLNIYVHYLKNSNVEIKKTNRAGKFKLGIKKLPKLQDEHITSHLMGLVRVS